MGDMIYGRILLPPAPALSFPFVQKSMTSAPLSEGLIPAPDPLRSRQAFAAEMDADLGIKPNSKGPGVRPLGRVENPEPFINPDGKVRTDASGKAERFP